MQLVAAVPLAQPIAPPQPTLPARRTTAFTRLTDTERPRAAAATGRAVARDRRAGTDARPDALSRARMNGEAVMLHGQRRARAALVAEERERHAGQYDEEAQDHGQLDSTEAAGRVLRGVGWRRCGMERTSWYWGSAP